MRIAMFLDTPFPPDSRVENEAVSLIRAGHEVHLFSLNYSQVILKEENVRGIHVHRYVTNAFTYKMSALAYTLPIFRQIVTPLITDFLKKVTPDVMHVHDLILGETCFKIARRLKLPMVIDLHENRPVIMKDYGHLKRFPGNILIRIKNWEAAQRRLVRMAGRVVVVTKEAKDQLLHDYNISSEKVTVVPNTIHPDIYLSYPEDQEIVKRFQGGFNLLYMGDTGLRRGTDTAIQALKLLQEKIPECRLILVGSNREDLRLQNMVKDYYLQDKVFFEGWQDVSKFPSYVAASDVCLSPLKRNLHHDTTYANKLFQYMALGKPVIVSDCPSQANVIREEEAGLVFEAGNANDLAEKIFTLYQHADIRKRMGENALNAVRSKWNWKETSKDLLKMYDSFFN